MRSRIRHLGPVAQDFHAAFGLGGDDKHTGTVDEEGVALAAIQGLHELLHEKDQRLRQQERELVELRRDIADIKAEVSGLKRPNQQSD